MPRTGPPPREFAIAFMVAWLLFWTASMLVATYAIGLTLVRGQTIAAVFMGLWLIAAAGGFRAAARRLRALLLDEPEPPPAPARRHRWSDGVTEQRDR